jgi:hypothetical protein
MKILTLFSRFGTDSYRDTDVRLRWMLGKQLPGVERDFIIIDTALPETHAEEWDEGVLLGASNDHWEFGAWSHALRKLGNGIFCYDYIHLATSALYQDYIVFHDFLSEAMLRRFSGRAAAFGHIEVYNRPVVFRGVRFQAWLRSSYIFLPPAEICMLGDMVSARNPREFFSEDYREPFLKDAPLNEQYKEYITAWLTGDGVGQGTTWHSRFALSPESFPLFKKKAMAIFNEMSVSTRLAAQGCTMVDMTWAHRHYDGDAVPSWYEQIVNRGTGHEFIVEG